MRFIQFGALTGTAAWLIAVGFLGFCVSSAQRLSAQVLYGSVVGTVTDQSGAVLPEAEVKVTNAATAYRREVTTNASGHYTMTEVPEGDYTLSVSAKGFKPLSKTGIRVIIGQVNQQDVQMQLGAVTQQVTVSASTGVLETQQSNVHTNISDAAIEALPLNIYHNFQAVEVLAPGVFSSSGISESYPNSIADTPDRSFAINTNGLPEKMNVNKVDGATDVFVWLPDHMVIVPPQASVAEVNVQTSNYSVDKGLTAGAATDIVTKSGTNQFHGETYGFHTDNSLNAQNSFRTSVRKPKDIRNNDGVAIGGPLWRNHAFFFFNWDGYFQHQNTQNLHVIPTEAMRQGDFSSFLGTPLFDANGNPIMVCTTAAGTTELRQGMVFDPTTGNPKTGQGRCVFANNIIPANRMYQGTVNFWNLMQPFQPNDQQGPFTTSTATNDIRGATQRFNRNIYTTRDDLVINDRLRTWGRYALQKSLLDSANDYGLAGLGGGIGLTNTTTSQGTLGYSWTVTPNLVSTGNVGFSYMRESGKTKDFGMNLGQSVLGLTNSNTPLDDPRLSGMPAIFIQGFSDLGNDQAWLPFSRNDWTATLDQTNTYAHGKHLFTFGANLVRHHLNQWQPEIICCVRGSVSETEYNTFLNLAPGAGTGAAPKVFTGSGAPATFTPAPWNSAAAFDLGLADEVTNANQLIKATNKEWQIAFFAGDTWRVTPKLTLNLGLRWEYFPIIDRDGAAKFEVYDPSTNTLKLGGLGGNRTHLQNTALGVTASKRDYAPRFGLAYRVNQDTVVRTGFGITYDTLPLSRPLRQDYPLDIGVDQFVAGNSNVTRFFPVSNFNGQTNTVNAVPGLNDGVPLIEVPPGFATGSITPPPDVVVETLQPGEFKRAYAEQWSFSVERKLPYNTFLTAAYVGNHLVHEYNARNINAATLGGGFAGQPFSRFGRSVLTLQGQGYLDSHYNSLQVSFKRSVSHGLFLQGSWTYSKVIGYEDNEAASAENTGLAFNCPPSALLPEGCQPLDRHVLSFDHTHMFKMGFVYDLPFGPHEKFANQNRILKHVVGRWKIDGIFTTWSGDPLELSQGASFLNTPGTRQVPDLVGKLKVIGGKGPGQSYFDTTAFKPVETARIGTAGITPGLRGPGLAQLDFSASQSIPLPGLLGKENLKLEWGMEAQNLTNTPHFNDPSTSCSDINGLCGGSFGQITSGFGQRIIQFNAKITF
jgi:hypothetical protein